MIVSATPEEQRQQVLELKGMFVNARERTRVNSNFLMEKERFKEEKMRRTDQGNFWLQFFAYSIQKLKKNLKATYVWIREIEWGKW